MALEEKQCKNCTNMVDIRDGTDYCDYCECEFLWESTIEEDAYGDTG